MSIPNFLDKIKGKIGLDKTSILYLLIIVGVGISSFGLGRLSVGDGFNNISDDNSGIIVDDSSVNSTMGADKNNISTSVLSKGGYVASKNGKMYYSVGCSGIKRIKPENIIRFNSKEDAEKAGYSLSALCK
jgi:hypothetical protein